MIINTKIKTILHVAHIRMMDFLRSPHPFAILMVIVLVVESYTSEIGRISKLYGIQPTAFGVFGHLTSNNEFMTIIVFGWLLMICNAPFIKRQDMYQLIRINSTDWILGQYLFLFTSSLFYGLGIYLLSTVFSNASFANNKWDTLLLSLSSGTIENSTPIIIHAKIISLYTPISSSIISFSLLWLALLNISLMMFLISILLNRSIALIVTGVVIVLDRAVYTILPYKNYKYSLISLARLEVISPYSSQRPNLQYCYFALCSIALFFLMACLLVARNHRIMSHAIQKYGIE